MSDKGVCRTAPATPGLFNTLEKNIKVLLFVLVPTCFNRLEAFKYILHLLAFVDWVYVI